MQRFSRLVFGVMVSLAAVACDDAVQPDFREGEACQPPASSGLIGLDLVDVSGNPHVTGNPASVFSNETINLVGNYIIDGDAVSGGDVNTSGSSLPGGSIVEGAGTITVPDPTEAVMAAKLDNDNATIPCIQSGNKCVSPVKDYILSLNGDQQITLQNGSYYFEGISINAQAKLNVNGTVIIYLNGPATFNGGAATNPDEDSLTIISSSTEEIKLNGGGSTTTHIYAPFAVVRFSGTQGFKGTALGRELRISGTADLEVTGDLMSQVSEGCPDLPGLPD